MLASVAGSEMGGPGDCAGPDLHLVLGARATPAATECDLGWGLATSWGLQERSAEWSLG